MKTILFLDLSLDGFIARPDDSVSWSQDVWSNYTKFCNENRNLIVGRKTYELMMSEGDMGTLRLANLIVVSASLTQAEGVILVRSPQEALSVLEAKGEGVAIVGGGASLATSFFQEQLIDEAVLEIDGCVLGGGIPLLRSSIPELSLKLIDVKRTGENSATLRYQVGRS